MKKIVLSIFSFVFISMIIVACSCNKTNIENHVKLNSGLELTYITVSNNSNEDNYYAVTSYNGNMPEVEIPATYNDIKVKAIFDYAFYDREIMTVIIPEGVEKIHPYAFAKSGIYSIFLPKSIKHIYEGAFQNCDNLEIVYYEGHIENWSQIRFGGPLIMENPMVHADQLYVRDINGSWYEPTKIKIDNITKIYSYTFYNLKNIKELILSSSITSIDKFAFYNTEIENIYYEGGYDEFLQIYIGDGNDYLIKNVLYYSDNIDNISENVNQYWHYDADGITPVVWDSVK